MDAYSSANPASSQPAQQRCPELHSSVQDSNELATYLEQFVVPTELGRRYFDSTRPLTYHSDHIMECHVLPPMWGNREAMEKSRFSRTIAGISIN